MDLFTLVILTFILILIMLFILLPFRSKKVLMVPTSNSLRELEFERNRVMDALQELDFDNNLGKIPADDYSVQRASLIASGVAVLKRIDALSQIDQKPDVKKTGSKQPSAPMTDEELEDLLTKRRSSRKGKSGGFCPSCGKPILATDTFCPSCGNAINVHQ